MRTIQCSSVVANNTVYQAVLDVSAAVINLYKWVGDEKSYGPVLVQTIACTTQCNHINMSKCADWVFIEAGYKAAYSSYKRAFFAANQSDMQFYPISYLVEGDYAFNNGVGDAGDGISTDDSTFVYCKIKSDGTMGMVMTYIDNYANSSSRGDCYRMNVLEFVNGKWMCVKALTTDYFIPAAIGLSVAPFYNPYLGVWQICVQRTDDTYVYLHSIDVAACYASGVLSATLATGGPVYNGAVWYADGGSYIYGVAYDTGSAIWLIPDFWQDEKADNNYALQIDSVDRLSKIRLITSSNYVDTIRIYGGKIYGFTTYRTNMYGIQVFDTIDDLIDNTGTVLTDNSDYPYINPDVGSNIYMPKTNDIAFGQGLYDHVLTGYGIQTPGYKLPAIAPDASYAYIKIKEATDD